MKVKAAQYIADVLVERGITDCFTVTGGGAMHLNDAFGHKTGLRCMYNHHEQACAIAAEAYARYSGRLALVCVTSGPGGTNALTGVLGGWLDSIPMLVISGQVKRETTIWSTPLPLRQLGDQEFNIADAAATMTKYAHMVTDPQDIAYHLEKALHLATHGRPGPVWLDIPLDVQGAQIETDELTHYDPREDAEDLGGIDDAMAQRMLTLIHNAQRPVLLAGTAIRLAGVYDEFIQLVEKLQIPVVTAWNAHDVLWYDSAYFCGKPGTVGTRGGNFVVQNSDLLLVLGSRLNIRMISYNKFDFAKNAYKIVVDIDAAELKKPTLKVDLPVHADLRDVIHRLLRGAYAAGGDAHKSWLHWCRVTDAKYPATLPQYYDKAQPLNPYAFSTELFHALDGGDRVICGNGSACVITFQAAEIKRGMRLFTNSGCASMGYGLPAAMGVSRAADNGRVVCIDGDGSIQMNLQELQTVAHYRQNLKIFVLNNNGYHSIRQTQTNLFQPPLVGVSADNGVGFPDFDKLAWAYGLRYVRIDSLEGIQGKLAEVLQGDDAVVCEVIVDEHQFFEPKLSSKVLPDGRIVSPSIDDMFPFLPKEEYEQNKRPLSGDLA